MFQQDHVPKYTSKSTQKWLQKHKISVSQRLSKCPDLTAVKTLVWIEEGSPHVQTWEYDRS